MLIPTDCNGMKYYKFYTIKFISMQFIKHGICMLVNKLAKSIHLNCFCYTKAANKIV